MLNILRFRLKSILTNKAYVLAFISIVISLVMLTIYIDNNSTEKRVFKIAIIDYNVSEMSKQLINDVEDKFKVDVTRDEDIKVASKKLIAGKYDAVYEIDKNFDTKLQKEGLVDLITVHKNEEAVNIKWLDDQIGVMILKNWIYYDLLDRALDIDPNMNVSEYKEEYMASMDKEKIFYLVEHDMNSQVDGVIKASIPSYYNMIWGFAFIVFLIMYGKNMIVERQSGILSRYEFSGITKPKYYMLDLIIKLMTLLVPYIISTLIISFILDIDFNIYLSLVIKSSIFIIVIWMYIAILASVFNDIKGYMFACQILLLMIIFLAYINADGGIFKYIGNVIPINWYINI